MPLGTAAKESLRKNATQKR